jgi:hypothetical protein
VPPGQGHRVVGRLRPDRRRGTSRSATSGTSGAPGTWCRPPSGSWPAGGHRSAAKAVIPRTLDSARRTARRPAMRRAIVSRFVHALDGTPRRPDPPGYRPSRVR